MNARKQGVCTQTLMRRTERTARLKGRTDKRQDDDEWQRWLCVEKTAQESWSGLWVNRICWAFVFNNCQNNDQVCSCFLWAGWVRNFSLMYLITNLGLNYLEVRCASMVFDSLIWWEGWKERGKDRWKGLDCIEGFSSATLSLSRHLNLSHYRGTEFCKGVVREEEVSCWRLGVN